MTRLFLDMMNPRFSLVVSCLLFNALLVPVYSSKFRSDVSLAEKSSEFSIRKYLDLNPEERSLLNLIGKLIGLSPDDVTALISVTDLGFGLVQVIGQIFTKVFNGSDIELDQLFNGKDRKILALYQIITHRLDQIEKGVQGTQSSLKELTQGLPHLIRWEIALNTLEEYSRPINNLYQKFDYYQHHKDEIEHHTLMDFAESVVSHNPDSILSLMANVHSMVAPSDDPVLRGEKHEEIRRLDYEAYNRVTMEYQTNVKKLALTRAKGDEMSSREARKMLSNLSMRAGVFELMKQALTQYNQCDMRQSQQQLIHGLYTMLALTMARGYSMVTYSWMLLRFHGKGNFTAESLLGEKLYLHYSAALVKQASEVEATASRLYRLCDPDKHIEGKTFVMMTELLQGYIENEVDLNTGGSCMSKCASYKHTQVMGCYHPNTQHCGQRKRCNGTVHDCQFFDADAWVCPSSLPYRRYDWIKYESNQVLGAEAACDSLVKVDSWWRFMVHCSYCMCLCDDPSSPDTDRYLSLLPSVSDIIKNKIVTGVRFRKVNQVMHMQIQEGLAVPQGQVDPDTLAWVQVPTVDVRSNQYKNGVDFMTFQYETRTIDLDQLEAPKGHVVTGVKFRMHGTHANLEVWVTPINFTTGELNSKLSFWISNDNTPMQSRNPRKGVYLVDPDDPRRSPLASEVDSEPDMFIEMEASSLHEDVSQLTVPFFDAQSVSPSPGSWLSGIDIYHRGRKGYGGFIGLGVVNFNISNYYKSDIVIRNLL